jgi:hypothetical protein|tara:strand:+ start:420 stop:659 length:240 start_codon:yes stop_codon:yes gene_type:complete
VWETQTVNQRQGAYQEMRKMRQTSTRSQWLETQKILAIIDDFTPKWLAVCRFWAEAFMVKYRLVNFTEAKLARFMEVKK